MCVCVCQQHVACARLMSLQTHQWHRHMTVRAVLLTLVPLLRALHYNTCSKLTHASYDPLLRKTLLWVLAQVAVCWLPA